MSKFILIVVFAVSLQLINAQIFSQSSSIFSSDDSKNGKKTNEKPGKAVNHPRRTTIIDVLKELRATTFLQLIQQTQLGDALQGSGPYTVFAPTDDAIDRIPKWAQRKLLADSELLAQMLVYHVSVGKITSKDFKNEMRIPTLLHGKPISVRLFPDKKPAINHVTVTVPDAIASNGVVHVIGDTLFPVPVGTIFDVINNCTAFSKFRDYVAQAGLENEFKSLGISLPTGNPLTVFVPHNDAFDVLPSRVKEALANQGSNSTSGNSSPSLQAMILHHVVLGTYYSPAFNKEGQQLTTAAEREIDIGMRNGRVSDIGLGRVVRPDIPATNGVVHAIDRFLTYDDIC